MFIDSARLYIKAGDGGSGCVAFRREKYVPKGGPSGGDGGNGGDIIVVANRHIHTLLDLKYKNKYVSQRGQHGQGDDKTGRSGKNTTIRLPIGTVVRDAESGQVIVDLTREGQSAVIALGGKGGRGNARFSTPTNRAPRTWETGGEGEEKNIDIELKLIADLGLVGLPNAGKSTLLSRISAARPKIADYPFTTLSPKLGIVKINKREHFVTADIPGLIKGAHEGKGLGIQFLRHIERTKVLAILLDASSENIENDYKVLLNELESYSVDLQKKSRLIVYTKADILEDNFSELDKRFIGNAKTILISSVRGDNLDEFKQIAWKMIEETEDHD